MKIIHLITGLPIGGAEKVVLTLSSGMQSKGHKVAIVSISSEYQFPETSTPLVFLNISKNPTTWLQGFKKWKSFLKEFQPDILHAHLFHAWVLAWLTPRKVSVAFNLHNSKTECKFFSLFLFLTRNKRQVDIIFSSDQRRWFHARNTAIIPNGINFDLFSFAARIPQSPFIILFAGRMTIQKRPSEFLEVLSKHPPKNNFKVWMAGSGELLESMSQNIYPFEIDWLGNVQNMPQLMNQADLLVLPSLWEGMPIVALEAAASGLPVLATPVGNLPELLAEERGFLSELQNFPNMIEFIMKHPQEAGFRAGKFYQYAKSKFSLETMLEMHLELYKTML